MKINSNTAKVTAHTQDTLGTFRKLTKKSWDGMYRSFDGGATWHKSTSGAFWAAYHSGKLVAMPESDVAYLNTGNQMFEKVA